jgi:flagellar biosynthesis protein FlhF
MQVKKFEAPTIAEALKLVKAELGPEAIILSTKNNKKGFGLLSKESVEVTAAISERAYAKKVVTEKLLKDEEQKKKIASLPASVQSKIYNNYTSYLEKRYQERNQERHKKYADIKDELEENHEPNLKVNQTKVNESDSKNLKNDRALDVDVLDVDTRSANQLSSVSFAELDKIKEELKQVKVLLSEVNLNKAQEENVLLLDHFQNLLRNGIEKKYASELIKLVTFNLSKEEIENDDAVFEALACEMIQNIKTEDPLDKILEKINKRKASLDKNSHPSVLALVGPTGVGKTTTLAKIASIAIIQKNLKVGLINIDDYKVGAQDQLATFAKILNVPFRHVTKLQDYERALAEFKPLDLILVDTSGRSQKDTENLKSMKELLDLSSDVTTALVLSTVTRDSELNDIVNRFKIFNPKGLIFSKLDESSTYGCIYNLAKRTNLPLYYFTNGQRVPEDIEIANSEKCVALILDI